MTIQEFEEKLLQYIDDSIDTATDDELFAGGYLRGHISLAASNFIFNSQEELFIGIHSSLVNSKSELSPGDFLLVMKYFDELTLSLRDR